MEDELNNLPKSEITEEEIYNNPIVFRTLSEAILTGIIVYDEKKLLYANPYLINLSGYSKEELLGMQFIDLIHPDFKDLMLRRAAERLSGKDVTTHYEFKANSKSGRELWVDFSVSTFEYKYRKLGIATLFDITERKKTEEEIKISKEEWENTFNSIEDIIFLIDKEYVILKANNAFRNLYNLKNKEIISKKCYELINETDELCHNCVALKSLEDKKPHIEEWEDLRVNRYFQISVSPLFDNKGNIKGFVHLARDISELKFAEKELIESVKIKSEFISTVSHELRTPLTAIKEGIDLFSKDLLVILNYDQKNVLEIIQRNINRLARHVNNVLDFQKLESGNIQFNVSKNNINEVLMEVYELMYPVASEKCLQFNLDLDKSLSSVMFDRDRIVQVITNLVNNSFKFTKVGSVDIISKNYENFIKITIHDTGVGIKEEDLPNIFQTFAQFGEPETRKGGTGLGLPICKEIIEKHNGRIWAESEFKKGTSFYFILPI